MMKKRFYLTLLILAVLVLAIPGAAAKAVRQLSSHPRRLAREVADAEARTVGR
jgi:hypothetical protein